MNLSLLHALPLPDFTLKNRVVMAPVTRSRSNAEGVLPDYAAEFYAQRADAGLLITEATNISPQAKGDEFTPGIWSESQIAAWRKVTEAVHARDGRIFMQLWHTGRVSHASLQPDGKAPVSASAIQANGQAFVGNGFKPYSEPRALELDEIAAVIADYRQAAENAKCAGFDGVEVHSANNYLLEQFIRDSTNQRSDRYGGSLENRLRFPLEVIRAVVDVWGAKRVGVRISPLTEYPGGTPRDGQIMATYGQYIDAMNSMGLLYLHMIEGNGASAPGVDMLALRQRFTGVYIANDGYDLPKAEAAIASQHADLISFGKLFIANPDLVKRFACGGPFADSPAQYFYGGGTLGYTDWPCLK